MTQKYIIIDGIPQAIWKKLKRTIRVDMMEKKDLAILILINVFLP